MMQLSHRRSTLARLWHSIVHASVEAKILGGFAGSLALLFVAGAVTYRTNVEFSDTGQWVAHTQQTRVALGRLYATVSDAESSQRNYLLTGNTNYRNDYLRTASMLAADEEEFARLVADNAAQQNNLTELQTLIARRMSILASHVSIFESRQLAVVQAAIAGDDGIRAKQEIKILVDRMDNVERQLLANREATLEHNRDLTHAALLATLLLATVLLLVLYFGIRRQIAARTHADQAVVVAKEVADSANRAKSTFLATMSHEIRTPMNGVLGMLELLSLTKLDAQQRTTLEIVRVSSKSLLRIIDDILDFSKIEAGKLEVRPEIASIREVIEDVHNIYSGNASSKGLLIKRSADPQISPAVLVDQLRLRQILNNFVSNALKFTIKGSIEIKAELISRAAGVDLVRFTVTDTGSGISAEDQERLFEPFSQGENDKGRLGGTGLGLTICRRLADMMGGTVELVSVMGSGTTMILTLSLPIADPKDLPQTVDPKRARDLLSTTANMRRLAPTIAQAEAEGTLALLVDDHPTNRTLLMRQVNALGYAAESAEDGVEALEKWKSGRFGIVITDCNMPKMDGYELAQHIRALESVGSGKHTPIVACTANALAGEAESCFAAGMDDYLVKPVELSQILKKLDQWLPIPAAVAPEEPGKGANASPVDRSALAEISGGDAATEREILLDFRIVNDKDAAMLDSAVATSNIPQVTRATHRILGASRMVGAMGLASVCERIETASRANDWMTIAANMDSFHQESIRLNAYLDAL